jgi:uncharacterized protein (TIGR03435 family)
MMRPFVTLLLPLLLLAQTERAPLRFEVCDIQVSRITDPQLMKADFLPGGRVDVRGMTLKVIVAAVNKAPEDMVSGPAWLGTERYDIVAKAVPTSTEDQLFEMARTMLTERFKLVSHSEKKVVPAYALIVGKKGAAMTAHTGSGDPDCTPAVGRQGLIHRECHALTMDGFAKMIPQIAPGYIEGLQVVDLTGLTGAFDFELNWMGRGVYNAAMSNTNGGPPSDAPVSFFDAVDKLGLKLENRKLPLDMIVVDSVLRTPVAN